LPAHRRLENRYSEECDDQVDVIPAGTSGFTTCTRARRYAEERAERRRQGTQGCGPHGGRHAPERSAVTGAGGNAATQASLRSIDIAFHKAVIASAFANNGGAGIGPSMEALRSLQGTAT
jgi:hypothetical protein